MHNCAVYPWLHAQGFAWRHPGGLALWAEEEAAQRRAAAAAAAEAASSAAQATPRVRSIARPPPAKPCARGGAPLGSPLVEGALLPRGAPMLGGTPLLAGAPSLGSPVGTPASPLGGSLLGRQSGGAARPAAAAAAVAERPSGGAVVGARTCSFAEAALVAADDMQVRTGLYCATCTGDLGI